MQEAEVQSEFKDNVKQWLRSNGRSYAWMADKCGVSEITFRNWMSQKNIPSLKQRLLLRAMAETEEAVACNSRGVRVDATLSLTIQLQADVYHKLEMCAASRGMTAADLITSAIMQLAEDV